MKLFISVVTTLVLLALCSNSVNAQGALTDGSTYTGNIAFAGDSDTWSFTATNGDSVVLRVGTLTSTNNFETWLRVYGPDSTLLGSYDPGSLVAAEVTFRATNSGAFTVVVSDGEYYNNNYGGTGTYQLSYVKTPGALVISPGQEGGPLTNGTLNAGTITVGALNAWSFTATNGDSVVLRAGKLSGGASFQPWLRVYGPDGTFVGSTDPESIAAAEVTFRATNSGTFTVVVADGFYYNGDYGDAGTYQLSYDKAPGTLVVSPGEEGGPLTNGTLNAGTITVGDIQAWSFTATNGDSVVLRAGMLSQTTGNFQPWLRVYGPDGTLVGSTDPQSIAAAEVTFRATNSGTFTVLVGDGFFYNGDYGDAGTYQLSYVKTPGALVISPGQEGGPLTNGTLNAGTITVGALNAWSFTATNGDSVVLRAGKLSGGASFQPWLRVYGPDGTFVGSTDPESIAAAEVTFRATNSGTFTVVVADGFYYNGDYGDAGTYQLSYDKAPGTLVVSPGEEGGPLTNGTLNAGTITVGDIQAWSFTATNGDSVVLRAGMLSQTTGNFQPWLRVYGPDGTLVGSTDPQSIAAAEVTFRATNSGTFTVLVGDGFFYNGDYGDAGTYQLSYVKTPGALVISPGQEGGPLTNGTLNAGTITVGALNAWSFTATNGDSVVLRAGKLSGGASFQPWLRVYGPDGTFVGSTDPESIAAAEVTFRATNSGTFTVVVADGFYYNGDYGDAGTYQLSYDKAPGTLVVSPGEEGGPLTNGTLNAGTITVGDIQAWSFTATNGDSVVLRAGMLSQTTGNFQPWLRVYGPDGTLVGSTDPGSSAVAEVTLRATNSGTFTVLVTDGFNYNGDYGDAGTYQLDYVKVPGSFVVPPGDQGGPLAGVTKYFGTITLADIDVWSFTACQGDSINLQLNTTNFYGNLQLYGPNGVLLQTATESTDDLIAYTATNCGTFTVLVSSSDYDGYETGTYGLTVNGLTYGFKTCSPLITGTSLNVSGVGGTPGTNAVLLTTTNIANPALWTPIRTNPFDQFGVFQYTNGFNPAEPKRFFRLSHP